MVYLFCAINQYFKNIKHKRMKKTFTLLSVFLSAAISFAQNSSFINRVYEYRPAPGQFINTVTSGYQQGNTESQVLENVNTMLISDNTPTGMVSLGGWGG